MKMDKPVKAIPEGFHTLTPYLIVKGGAKAIEFYKKAFQAKELDRHDMGNGIIAHAELQIGNSKFMIADEFPDKGILGPQSLSGASTSFLLYVEDVDAFAKNALAAGIKLKRPVENQFYGDRSGTFEDPFGHIWTIATHIEDVTPEEMKQRMEKLYINAK